MMTIEFTESGEIRADCPRCGTKIYYSSNKTVRYIFEDTQKHFCDILGSHKLDYLNQHLVVIEDPRCTVCNWKKSAIIAENKACLEAQRLNPQNPAEA